VREEFKLSRNEWDWVGSIVNLGAAISCLPIGYLMKAFGRKWTMFGLVVPFLIG
jgi:MFS family permease